MSLSYLGMMAEAVSTHTKPDPAQADMPKRWECQDCHEPVVTPQQIGAVIAQLQAALAEAQAEMAKEAEMPA